MTQEELFYTKNCLNRYLHLSNKALIFSLNSKTKLQSQKMGFCMLNKARWQDVYLLWPISPTGTLTNILRATFLLAKFDAFLTQI
jgi:hypothetical protein